MTASAHFKQPIRRLALDCDHWLFAADHLDPVVAHSKAEAERIADDWRDLAGFDFSVIRFNAAEGRCRDVSEDFWPAEDERGGPDEDCTTLVRARGWR